MLERARRLNPSNLDVLMNLGRLHGLRYDYAGAEECFEQAVRIAPKKSEVLVVAGQQCRDFNNLTMAEDYLKRASDQNDVSPTILVKLAEVYERLRRVEDAASLVDRALQLEPSCVSGLLLRSRLDRQAGLLELAESRLRTFRTNIDPAIRASARYELGGILDRQGRYEEAMNAFLEAKSLLLPLAERPAAELKIIRARIKNMTASISDDLLQQWADSRRLLQPEFRLTLLGGHPRSGTTLLEQVLDSHPDIVSAEETEIFYNDAFGPLLSGHPDDTAMFDALAGTTTERLQQTRQNYFHNMEASLGHPLASRLLIDKNPSYTFLIPAFVRIFPEARLIIALRDPRDVVLSCFMQDLPLNHAGAAFLDLKSTVAEYSALMDVWCTIKPLLKNPWLEVRYEDMVDDLDSIARRTLGFLEVPWDKSVLNFDQHAREKVVRSPTYADVAKPVYKSAKGRWRHYQKYLEPHLEKLEPFAKAFGYG